MPLEISCVCVPYPFKLWSLRIEGGGGGCWCALQKNNRLYRLKFSKIQGLHYLCFCFLLSFCDFFLALLQTMYVMPVLLILKQATSTRMKPRMRMATMAPMIAPKGTCVSWKGGKVEYSPVPKEEEFIIPIKRLHCDYSWKINEYKIDWLQKGLYLQTQYLLSKVFWFNRFDLGLSYTQFKT